eukprot:6460489-Amphidinium_carterae.1
MRLALIASRVELSKHRLRNWTSFEDKHVLVIWKEFAHMDFGFVPSLLAAGCMSSLPFIPCSCSLVWRPLQRKVILAYCQCLEKRCICEVLSLLRINSMYVEQGLKLY